MANGQDRDTDSVGQHNETSSKLTAMILVGCGTALTWAYWTTFAQLAEKWGADPQYSHGYLVPLFATVLLWLRRSEFQADQLATNWWGLLLLLTGVGLRIAGAYYYYDWFDAISIIPVIGGICLLVGGLSFFAWAVPAVIFLFFMVPLPFRLEIALQYPLRRIGTMSSVYLMQTIGLPVLGEGNVIVMGETRIGVAEACSGLRMLMIFFALTTAVALVSPRLLWERILIVMSAIPIALFTNVIRITATGTLYYMNQSELANLVFHDLAGWLMMPFALLLLWIELWLLSRIIITEDGRPVTIALDR